MKTFIYLFIAFFTGFIISCSEEEQINLSNTCWELSESIPYKDQGFQNSLKDEDNEESFIFHFIDRDELIINESFKTSYQIQDKYLVISGIHYDIIEFTDKKLKTLEYTSGEFEEPIRYKIFKKISCKK